MSGRKDQADRRVRPRRDSGAVQSRSTFAQQLRAWLENHRQGALQSLQRLLRAPLASMLTWLAIGIALALPCVLFVALNNVQQLTAGWDGAARISAFLSDGVSATEGLALAGSYGGCSRRCGRLLFDQLADQAFELGDARLDHLDVVLVELEDALAVFLEGGMMLTARRHASILPGAPLRRPRSGRQAWRRRSQLSA